MNYLQRRNGVYYFHKRVSVELSKDGNSIIRKSLKTKCYNTAKKLVNIINYWIYQYDEVGEVMQISEMIDFILKEFYLKSQQEYSEFERIRHQKNTITKKNGKVYEGSTKKALLHHLKKFNKVDERRDFKEVKEYVEKEIIPISMLKKEHLKEFRNMEEFYWSMFKFYGNILNFDLETLSSYSVEKAIDNNKKPKQKIVNKYYGTVKEDKKDVIEDSFDVMVDKYLAHLKEKKKLSLDTLNDYRPSYELIKEVFPNKKISQLETVDLQLLEDIIKHMPSNRNKLAETRDLTIVEQVKLMKKVIEDRSNNRNLDKYEKLNPISERTQNKHYEQISNFIEYCSKIYKFDSPLDGIVLCRYRVKSSASTERLLLNDEEIKAIFENFDYLNKNLYKTLKTDPLKVYGILLMMYLGIRPIEAGQLMVNDLQETKDSEGNTIYYLSVSDENSSDNKFFNETKSQKTDNARRKLPLTDLLIKDFRFLAFVEKRKKDKHNFIFIDDENESTIINEIKNTVRRCEDTFNRYLKKLNLKDSNRKTFYSLRHSFANKIKHIPESLRDKRGESLMGHSRISDSELFNRYGNKYFEPDFLYEILEKINYKDVDFIYIKDIFKKFN
ncbi:DUF6538 domain-containing protein [Aliarcobacter butzleri]|uniref:DUF6538 domain-containing protein n=1 Tax=Aliarcobacter butzleri TaxID=28197 RepID=UPI003AF5C118